MKSIGKISSNDQKKAYLEAIAGGHSDISKSFKPNDSSEIDFDYLHGILGRSIENGNTNTTRALLEFFKSDCGELYLNEEFIRAFKLRQLEIVKFFLEMRVQISEETKHRAFQEAREKGFLEIADVLFPDRGWYEKWRDIVQHGLCV